MGVNSNKKLNLLIVLLLTMALSLSSCSSNRSQSEITDVNDLKGKTIAVKMGFDSDYHFSKFKDINVVRYNTSADMLLAMKNKYVDAIAGTKIENNFITQVSTGVKVLPEPAAEFGSVFAVANEDAELLNELNEFLIEFKKTDEYSDIVRRFEEATVYEYETKDIPLTGTGKTIVLVMDPAEYPFSFYDYEDEAYRGIEIEIISSFANKMNYKLEFIQDSATMVQQHFINNTADIGACDFSDVYKEEAEMADVYKLSEPYYIDEITLLVPDETGDYSLYEELDF